MTAIEDEIRVSPAADPAGDLSRYAPTGNGVGNMMVALPYGAAPSGSPGYALHPHHWEPILGAPISEDRGGTIYFGEFIAREDFDAVLRVLGVGGAATEYAAYVERTRDIGARRFATQLRIVSSFALEYLYRSEKPAAQPLSLGDALWRFIAIERETAELGGTLGGDGDWASEEVAFGFLVENAYFGVYRIWSRPWLCTK